MVSVPWSWLHFFATDSLTRGRVFVTAARSRRPKTFLRFDPPIPIAYPLALSSRNGSCDTMIANWQARLCLPAASSGCGRPRWPSLAYLPCHDARKDPRTWDAPPGIRPGAGASLRHSPGQQPYPAAVRTVSHAPGICFPCQPQAQDILVSSKVSGLSWASALPRRETELDKELAYGMPRPLRQHFSLLQVSPRLTILGERIVVSLAQEPSLMQLPTHTLPLAPSLT